jgi:hypothetical protein
VIEYAQYDDGSVQAMAKADMRADRPLAVDTDTWVTRCDGNYRATLERATSENWHESEMHRFLEQHAPLVPGAGGAPGWGHQGPRAYQFMVSEPQIKDVDQSFAPDFMWVRTDSGTVHVALIEIERPTKKWFSPSSRVPSADFSQAQNQLATWRGALEKEANRAVFAKQYELEELLYRRSEERSLRFEYHLVYGRASEFDPAAGSPHGQNAFDLKAHRKQLRREGERLQLFDSLSAAPIAVDAITVQRKVRGRLEVVAVQPTFRTGPRLAPWLHRLEGLDEALRRLAKPVGQLGFPPYISPERCSYLLERIDYWREAHSLATQQGARWLGTTADLE